MKQIASKGPTKIPLYVGFRIFLLCLLVLASGYAIIIARQSVAPLQPTTGSSSLRITTVASHLPWPAYGQGAFGLADGQVIASNGVQDPVPTASTAKVLTALVVLQKKPLAANSDGPTITLGSNDVALYNQYVTQDGSVVAVTNGEQLTERQALQAILLPSANNIADSLAMWAFGSLADYKVAADQYIHANGLTNTQVGSDASGFAPDTTSTAHDLVKIGALAMQNAAIAQIVGQPSASLPGVGLVHNVNSLLGSADIIGVKTGNSDQDGGVFIGAATAQVAGKTVTLISALAGAPNLDQVLADSRDVLAAASTTFASTTIVHKGDVLGGYRQANGTSLQAIAANDLNIVVLRGSSVGATISLGSVSYGAKVGDKVGSVRVPATEFASAQSQPIILKQAPLQPGIWYRLLHP